MSKIKKSKHRRVVARKSVVPMAPRRLLGLLTSAERKKYPMATGLLDYFPDALPYVAHVSYLGNEKHNPGQPLHHSRGKSADHADCVARHMVERGEVDPDGIEHLGEAAWRALMDLQEHLERKHNLSLPRGARFDEPDDIYQAGRMLPSGRRKYHAAKRKARK